MTIFLKKYALDKVRATLKIKVGDPPVMSLWINYDSGVVF